MQTIRNHAGKNAMVFERFLYLNLFFPKISQIMLTKINGMKEDLCESDSCNYTDSLNFS